MAEDDPDRTRMPAPTPGQGPTQRSEYPKGRADPGADHAENSSWQDRLKTVADFASRTAAQAAEKAREGKQAYDDARERRAQQEAEQQRRTADLHREYTERRAQEQAERLRRQAARDHEEAERRRVAFEKRRLNDIARAMSRNVSTGGSGTPYLVIDIVQAMETVGGPNGVASPHDAMEVAKDTLWAQCQYLGGDAVLFCRFELKEGAVYTTNPTAVMYNMVSGVVRTASRDGAGLGVMNTQKEHATVTVIAYGTVVKLMPRDASPQPDDYANWTAPNDLPDFEIPDGFRG